MIKKENKDENIKMFIIFWITEIIMFAYGNITKPYACTMDFRYIVPTILTGMIFISTALKDSKQFNYKIALSVTILFVILSMSFVLTDMSLLTKGNNLRPELEPYIQRYIDMCYENLNIKKI